MKTPIKKMAAVLALVGITALTPVKAQVSAGLLGAESTCAVEIKNLSNRFVNETARGTDVAGYEAGAFVKLKTGPVYVKPILFYAFNSGEVSFRDQCANFKSHKISVPLLFGLHLFGPLNIEAGPVYNYVTSATEQYNAADVTLAKNGIGYRAGVALEFGAVMLTASYGGMTYPSSGNRTAFKEPHQMIFGAGLKFGK